MSDSKELVERLRGADQCYHAGKGWAYCGTDCATKTEAAARIEALEAENERLREALESIDAVACDFGFYESGLRTVKEIARKAIREAAR